jgi:hypothetical protein
MPFSKTEIEAIQKLPAEYVRDGLRFATLPDRNTVCAHPELPPLFFKDGAWSEIKPLEVEPCQH